MIAEASTDRIEEVLKEVPEMQDKEDAVKEVPDGSISFENVDFSYAGEGGNLSLKNINIHIKSGQTIGIIGGTGSAKSTFVQMIPRLYDVTGGSVKVGGIDVREYNLEALRDQVSMVLQKNVLFSGTIYENIRWGNEHATDEEVQRVCKLAQADGFVQEFPNKYNTMIVQGGNNVSGGQKQRLCIARALQMCIRDRMGRAAIKAAKAAHYVNAGTIEFLLESNEQFYFMEVRGMTSTLTVHSAMLNLSRS